uniref:Uncharacterized protein n=2 Tax=Acidianus TaxID=12914 RepID=A0A2U9IQ12_9CREN
MKKEKGYIAGDDTFMAFAHFYIKSHGDYSAFPYELIAKIHKIAETMDDNIGKIKNDEEWYQLCLKISQ